MYEIRPGDTIGIVSPSAPIAGYCPKRLDRGAKLLEHMGYKVKLGKNVSQISDYTAGSASDRVSDIHSMFEDVEIMAVIATVGGFNANDLLDKLDYKFIADHKKIFIGYSDITVLLSALSKLSGIKAIMGPMILPQFGEFPGMLEFTKDSFQKVTQGIGSGEKYVLPQSDQWTEEMLLWDKEDNRPRNMAANEGWKVVSGGMSRGRLVAGNLNSLVKLIGTPYIYDFQDAILFLEDDDSESPATVRRMLMQMKQANLLVGVKGFVFGRFQKKSNIAEQDIRNIFEVLYEKVEIPVIMNADFGHTDPMLCLPIGNEVVIDTEKSGITVIL